MFPSSVVGPGDEPQRVVMIISSERRAAKLFQQNCLCHSADLTPQLP